LPLAAPAPIPPPTEPWNPATFTVEPVEGKLRFHDLGLPEEIMHAIADLQFKYCTPIQAEILPHLLKGSDAAGRAQTGTGKTAAFLIAIFTHFLRKPMEGARRNGTPRALILAPTRELVLQIEKDARALGKYCPFRILSVFGGMDYQKQKNQLRHEIIDLVVATPGRLIDYRRGNEIHLGHVEVLVIDEADRMLDMGFIPDVREIVHSTPPKSDRQTLLFSATLTPDVMRLTSSWTREPIMIEIQPEQVAVDTVDQVVYITTTQEKFALLYNVIQKAAGSPVIVFGNRRDETSDLTDKLKAYGVSCALLSGAVPQDKRMKTLESFKNGGFQVLVATDVAGRGIHVEGISHVINYNLPLDPEDYVHRIGRTGRAGALGTSISFACEEDSFYLPEIEKYMGRELKCIHPTEDLLQLPPPPPGLPAARPSRHRGPHRPGGDRGRRGGGRRGGGRGHRS